MGLSWLTSSFVISSFDGPRGPGVPVTWTAVQSGIAWRRTFNVSGSWALKSAGMMGTVLTARGAVAICTEEGYQVNSPGGYNSAAVKKARKLLWLLLLPILAAAVVFLHQTAWLPARR